MHDFCRKISGTGQLEAQPIRGRKRRKLGRKGPEETAWTWGLVADIIPWMWPQRIASGDLGGAVLSPPQCGAQPWIPQILPPVLASAWTKGGDEVHGNGFPSKLTTP